MAYDTPYRLEEDTRCEGSQVVTTYAVYRTGEGEICSGRNFSEMRRLVDVANEAVLLEQGHRGR